MTSREWIALAALIIGPNGIVFITLRIVLKEIRKWDRIAWQHNMMWQEYAHDHGIPVNGERANVAGAGAD